MTIRNLLADQKYQQKKVLEKILCHHTGLTKEHLMLSYDTEINADTLSKIDHDYELYTIHDKPLEYIFGYVEFFQRRFKIDGRSLIPRPETEYMIEAINEHITNSKLKDQNSESNKVLLDVGTGTGVLGLSVLLDNPNYFDTAVLSEYYENTLSLAKENYEHYKKDLGTHTQIHVIQANLVDFLINSKFKDQNSELNSEGLLNRDDSKEEIQNTKYKIQNKYGELSIVLVANLPYIPDEVFDTQTEDNVRKREPRPAFVGGHDGLNFYREMFGQIFNMGKEMPLGKWTMFLEMMTWQVDILRKEFGDKIDFEEIKTFHFNIRIVKGTLK